MKIFQKQLYHLLVFILLSGLAAVISQDQFLTGKLFGISTAVWLGLSLAAAGLHQLFVALLWRSELYYQTLSRLFGELAFRVWGIGFMVLFLARPLLVIALAAANRNTLSLPLWLGIFLSIIILLPGIYLLISIRRYFGFRRALGEDHFLPEEYRGKPFVRKGIFRWTSNPMYIFGFLMLWIPGLILRSRTALLAAAFNQIFIWAHYFFTELPDIKFIYDKHPAE